MYGTSRYLAVFLIAAIIAAISVTYFLFLGRGNYGETITSPTTAPSIPSTGTSPQTLSPSPSTTAQTTEVATMSPPETSTVTTTETQTPSTTTTSLTTSPTTPTIVLKGRWVSIGPDGGDMHFVYVASDHTVFASHGFGGVWRSTDGGESWDLIVNEDFIDLNFMCMDEVDGVLYAGGNKGIWRSSDGGVTWERVVTGDPYIDADFKYEVVSVVGLSKDAIAFSVTIDKDAYREGFREPKEGFFLLEGGELKFFEIPVKPDPATTVHIAYDPDFGGMEVFFVSSTSSGLYAYWVKEGSWERILSKNTTKVYVDRERDVVYVGTIGDWYYIGRMEAGSWTWEHVTIPGTECAVAAVIIPDPYNPSRLWIGAVGGGRGTPYKLPPNLEGASFVGVGVWEEGSWAFLKLSKNWGTSIAVDKHREGEDPSQYVIETPFDPGARVAYVAQAGSGNIQKTEDGGVTWRRAYSGINADTINKITYIESGVLSGAVVITCVSGTQITLDLGESWVEGIDFTIGDIGYGMPGYQWGAASPPYKLEGRYDLLIATGYPPTTFTGNGVYAIDTGCLASEGKDCMKRLTDGPVYSIVVVGDIAYVGRMDSGVDVLDLRTYAVRPLEGIPSDEAGMTLLYYDGKLFVSTEKGGNRNTDSYFFSDRRSTGGLYVCTDTCRPIYRGPRVISFSLNGEELIALTIDGRILYFRNYLSGEYREVTLPPAAYSDMAVDWGKGVIYLSTFDPDTPGVLYASLNELCTGQGLHLTPITEGLLTNRVRDLELVNGVLFAGTEGHSAWRLDLNE